MNSDVLCELTILLMTEMNRKMIGGMDEKSQTL